MGSMFGIFGALLHLHIPGPEQGLDPNLGIAIQKYITDINEPFTHKIKGILASFGCQTQLEEVCIIETTSA